MSINYSATKNKVKCCCMFQMDESWKHAKWTKQDTKGHILNDIIYENRQSHTENRLVIALELCLCMCVSVCMLGWWLAWMTNK